MALHIVATVHHGDYYATFEVDASKATDLLPFFAQSPYMPRSDVGVDLKARQIWRDLAATGHAEFGWVRYTAQPVTS